MILWIGQVGDDTVRYLAVPAILLVTGYRVLAARKIRASETAIAVAAAASVPLAMLTRTVMQHFGAYATVPAPTRISPVRQWPRHLVATLRAILTLFGVQAPARATPLSAAAAVFGLACLMAAAFGFAKVVLRWRSAGWADHCCASRSSSTSPPTRFPRCEPAQLPRDRRGAPLRCGPRGPRPGAQPHPQRGPCPGGGRDSGGGRAAAAGRRGCPASGGTTVSSAGRLAPGARAQVRPGGVLGRLAGHAGVPRPGSGSRGDQEGWRLPRLQLGDGPWLVQPVPVRRDLRDRRSAARLADRGLHGRPIRAVFGSPPGDSPRGRPQIYLPANLCRGSAQPRWPT